MFSMRFLRRPLLVGVLVGAAAVASGVAIAGTAGIVGKRATLGSIQTVSACIHNGNSQLRVVSDLGACGDDTAVSWSATVGGLSGQVGDVYTTREASGLEIPLGSWVRVLHLSLPPGSYVLSAKTQLGRVCVECRETRVIGFCFLDVGGHDQNVIDRSGMLIQDHAPVITLPNQGVATFTGPTVVNLECLNDSLGDESDLRDSLSAASAVLTAVVAGKVNVQKP